MTYNQKAASDVHKADLRGFKPNRNYAFSPSNYNRIPKSELLKRYTRWVFTCININSNVAASIKPRLFRVVTKGGENQDKALKSFISSEGDYSPSDYVKKAVGSAGGINNLEEIYEHPLLDLINDVNHINDGFSFRKSIYSDMDIFGECFIHIVYDEVTGLPTELWRLMPDITRPVESEVNFVDGYEYGDPPSLTFFSPEEVIWIKHFDPRSPWGALGPLEANIKAIDSDNIIAAYQEDLFLRGGSPDWLMSVPGGMSEKQVGVFQKAWDNSFGKLFRRKKNIVVVPNDSKLQRLSDSNRELEFMKGKEILRDEIIAGFGVPKSFVTSEDVNKSNDQQNLKIFHRLRLWPTIKMMEEALNQRLVKIYGEDLILIHHSPLPEDRELRIKERESKLKSGWSYNEIRLDDGVPRIDEDWADEPMTRTDIVRAKDIMKEKDINGNQSKNDRPDPE